MSKKLKCCTHVGVPTAKPSGTYYRPHPTRWSTIDYRMGIDTFTVMKFETKNVEIFKGSFKYGYRAIPYANGSSPLLGTQNIYVQLLVPDSLRKIAVPPQIWDCEAPGHFEHQSNADPGRLQLGRGASERIDTRVRGGQAIESAAAHASPMFDSGPSDGGTTAQVPRMPFHRALLHHFTLNLRRTAPQLSEGIQAMLNCLWRPIIRSVSVALSRLIG
ncbi:hypothetical protein FB451DRAFT_1175860 [Mycena latifolia]|nr:hypothetical protein FB451DRAFT_1175860 [Mycena latifolia]